MKCYKYRIDLLGINAFAVSIMLIFSLQITSCKKYLDKKSDNKLVVPHTLSDLQKLLDDSFFMNKRSTPSIGSASADNYFLTQDMYNSFSDKDQKSYIWENVPYYYGGSDWASCYKAVFNTNYSLDYIKKIPKTSENNKLWDNVKGSALFFRSYYFLDLAWDYAKAYNAATAKSDMGIVLRLSSDFNIPSKRSDVQDTYAQIIKDATEASKYLPNTPQHVMRPSKCAAYGLLARTYLSMGIYDSAYKYSSLSLDIKKDLIDYNSPNIDLTSYNPFSQFNEEMIFFTTMSSAFSTESPFFALVDTTLYSMYAANDLRKDIFFFHFTNDDYFTFRGSYASIDLDLFTGIATDEIYLIKSECAARIGKIDEAMKVLNSLLIKRWKTGTFIPYKAITKQDALEIILTERRKELLFRGLRWMDIKRLNKEGLEIIPKRIINGKTYTLRPNDNRYALPLPADIIKITGMKQNPN